MDYDLSGYVDFDEDNNTTSDYDLSDYVEFDNDGNEIVPDTTLETQQPEDNEGGSEFLKGVSQGIDNIQSTLYGGAALIGDAVDSDNLRDWGLEGYRRNQQEAQENAGRITDYRDIENFGDTVDYIAQGVGQMIPSLVTIIGSGGVGGYIAKKTAEKVVKKFVEEKVTNSVSKEGIEKLTNQVLKKATQRGQNIGAYGSSVGIATGSIYGGAADEGAEGAGAIIPSIAGGIASGVLEALPVMQVAKRYGFGDDMASYMKQKYAEMSRPARMATMGTKTGGQEFATEMGQTFIEEGTKAYILERDLPEDIGAQLLNSGFTGFAGGTTVGTLAGVAKPDVEDNTQQPPPVNPDFHEDGTPKDNLDKVMDEVDADLVVSQENLDAFLATGGRQHLATKREDGGVIPVIQNQATEETLNAMGETGDLNTVSQQAESLSQDTQVSQTTETPTITDTPLPPQEKLSPYQARQERLNAEKETAQESPIQETTTQATANEQAGDAQTGTGEARSYQPTDDELELLHNYYDEQDNNVEPDLPIQDNLDGEQAKPTTESDFDNNLPTDEADIVVDAPPLDIKQLKKELDSFTGTLAKVKQNPKYYDKDGKFQPSLALKERQESFDKLNPHTQKMLVEITTNDLKDTIEKRKAEGRSTQGYEKELKRIEKGEFNANSITQGLLRKASKVSLKALNKSAKAMQDSSKALSNSLGQSSKTDELTKEDIKRKEEIVAELKQQKLEYLQKMYKNETDAKLIEEKRIADKYYARDPKRLEERNEFQITQDEVRNAEYNKRFGNKSISEAKAQLEQATVNQQSSKSVKEQLKENPSSMTQQEFISKSQAEFDEQNQAKVAELEAMLNNPTDEQIDQVWDKSAGNAKSRTRVLEDGRFAIAGNHWSRSKVFKTKKAAVEAILKKQISKQKTKSFNLLSTSKFYDKTQTDTRFSKKESTNKNSLPDEELHAITRRVVGAKAAESTVVIGDFSAFPKAIQNEAKKQSTKADEVYAVYHKGKIYLNRDNMTSERQVEEALFHEGTHSGLRKLFADKDVKVVMRKLYVSMGRSKGLLKLADQMGVDLTLYHKGTGKMTYDESIAMLTEELIAHVGEKGSRGIKLKVRELIGKVKDWLIKRGLTRLAKNFTANDLAHLARVSRESGLGKTGASNADVRFMVMTMNDDFKYGQPSDKFKSEIDRIMNAKSGESKGLLFNKDVGPIDVMYGKPGSPDKKFGDGYGLSHIFAKHPEINLYALEGIVASAKKLDTDKYGDNRLFLETPDHELLIKLDWMGKDKKWLLTAYEPIGGENTQRIGSDISTDETSSNNPSNKNINQNEENSKDVLFSKKSQSITDKFESDMLDKAITGFKRQRWGVLTLRQIADVLGKQLTIFKDEYIDRFKQYETAQNTLKESAGKVVKERKKLSRAENEKLSQLQHEATIAGVDPSKDFQPLIDNPAKARARIGMLNALMQGRPGDGKQKYMDEIKQLKMDMASDKERKKVYPELKRKWDALSNKAQTVYKKERDHHSMIAERRLEALKDNINLLEGENRSKAAMIKKLEVDFEQLKHNAPYFPLARFGKFWVSTIDADGVKGFDMFESERAQKRFIKQMKQKGIFDEAGQNLEDLRKVSGLDAEFVMEVDSLLKTLGESTQVTEIRDQVYQMYLHSLPELSARKHFIHRKKTKGYHDDQMRAFADKAQHDANHIARLENMPYMERMIKDAERIVALAGSKKRQEKALAHADDLEAILNSDLSGVELTNAIREANKDSILNVKFNGTQDELMADVQRVMEKERYYVKQSKSIKDVNFVTDGLNEIRQSHEYLNNPNTHPIAQGLNTLGFTWYLGASPAAALVNLTQMPTVSLPMMMASKKFKNPGKHLLKASADFIKNGFTINKGLTPDEAKAFQEWHDSSLIENTMSHDLSGVADAGIDTGTFRHKLMNAVGFMFHHAERMNREVTAMAAYRAAKEAGLTNTSAKNAASDLTWDSHFDYSSGNRARFMRGNTMRVVTQFKQYSQNITYLYAKTFMQAFKDGSKEEKAEARKLLTGLFSMQLAVAGGFGLPLASTTIGILQGFQDAFGDEDEPVSVKAEIRQALADVAGKDMAHAMSHGLINAFTPLNVAGRLSLADLWIRTSDLDLEGRAKALDYVNALGGPMVGLFTNGIRAQEMMANGNIMRGVETAMPKFVKDYLKSARYGIEGAQTFQGTQIKDMDAGEIVAQMMGFSSSELSELYEKKNEITNVSKKRTKRRKDLIDKMLDARQDGDYDAIKSLQQEIRNWNKANPQQRITYSTIRRALKSRGRYRDQIENGIRKTKANADLLEAYTY